MFNIIFWILGSFLSIFGTVMFFGLLYVLFAEEIATMFSIFIFSLLITIFIFVGIYIDKRLRKRFHLLHKKAFSYLWLTLSIIELSVFVVLCIIINLKIIPFVVLIYDVLIYLLLSFWILSKKIKKLSKKTFRVKIRKTR